MDCNFTTIKTCELKDSAFRSRILDFGDFDISDYTFSAVYKAGFDQIISEQELTAIGNILTVPLEAIEGASNRAKVEVWMFRDGGFKDKVIVFDVVISATGCPSDASITEGVSVTFGGLKVPVTVTQAVYMNVTDEQLDAIAQPAIEAAALANQAATNADTAAGLATDATVEAVNATGQAIAATAQAENAAENADEAAEAANEAAENALSGIKGTAVPATVPSTTGFERWLVYSAGTYTNFKGAGNVAIVVSAADLDVVNGAQGNDVILEVNNGVATKRVVRRKGDVGKSIVSISKTATVGEVDTYTITYSDATTTTFSVTNGKSPSGILNVTAEYPLSAGNYYTPTTARAAVPAGLRKEGGVITYLSATKETYVLSISNSLVGSLDLQLEGVNYTVTLISGETNATKLAKLQTALSGSGWVVTTDGGTNFTLTRSTVGKVKTGVIVNNTTGVNLRLTYAVFGQNPTWVVEQFHGPVANWSNATLWTKITKGVDENIVSTFPFKSYVDFEKIKQISAAIVDLKIYNPNSSAVYFIGYVNIVNFGHTIEIQIQRQIEAAISNVGVLSFGLFDSNITTKSLLSTGKENVVITANVPKLFNITSNVTGINSVDYEIETGGRDSNKIAEGLKNYNILKQDSPVNLDSLFIDKAVKSVKIIGYNPARYYFIEVLNNQPARVELSISSSSDAQRTTDIKLAGGFVIQPRGSGVIKRRANGLNHAGAVEVVIDMDFLNRQVTSASLSYFGAVGDWNIQLSDDLYLDGVLHETLTLQNLAYEKTSTADGATFGDFKKVGKIGNAFNNFKSSVGNTRANAASSYTVKEDGVYQLGAYFFNKSTMSATSMANNLELVSAPYLPPTPYMAVESSTFREPSSQEFVHPEIVDTGADAIGGYRYWIFTSTFPAAQDAYEDECIFVSNDLITWKRVRGYGETYNAANHATNLVSPPHELTPTNDNRYFQFLPFPRIGTITVNGESKTIASGWSHDPAFTYDPTTKALYFYITRNIKFVGDAIPGTAVTSNQFNILVRTYNGKDWEVVRNDGTTLPLTSTTDSLLLFTQSGGKNNYLRHRDHLEEEKGSSIIKNGSEWWLLHGTNGSKIYKGANIWSVDYSNPTIVNSATGNHPSHFVRGANVYRWDHLGLSIYNGTNAFTKLNHNPFYVGFRAEDEAYKKSIWVNADGTAYFVSAEYRNAFYNLFYAPTAAPFTVAAVSNVTVGKVKNIDTLIASATTPQNGAYYSSELFINDFKAVILKRNAFVTNTAAANSYAHKILHNNITLKKGQVINVDITAAAQGSVDVSVSEILLKRIN